MSDSTTLQFVLDDSFFKSDFIKNLKKIFRCSFAGSIGFILTIKLSNGFILKIVVLTNLISLKNEKFSKNFSKYKDFYLSSSNLFQQKINPNFSKIKYRSVIKSYKSNHLKYPISFISIPLN